MSLRINPSRNAAQSAAKGKYGYVIRVPELPEAFEKYEDVVVFLETDKRFYKCDHINDGDNNYWRWRAVTFGTARQYFIPVGKLSASDETTIRNEYNESNTFDDLVNTYNEIVFGFKKYNIAFDVLGFRPVEGEVVTADDVYRWTWADNSLDLTEIIDPDSNLLIAYKHARVGYFAKVTTGYTAGSDVYQAGDFVKLPTNGVSLIDDTCSKINKVIEFLNEYNAELLPASLDLTNETGSIDQLCSTINAVIDHINPFASAWQVILNHLGYIDAEIGDFDHMLDHIYNEFNVRKNSICAVLELLSSDITDIHDIIGESEEVETVTMGPDHSNVVITSADWTLATNIANVAKMLKTVDDEVHVNAANIQKVRELIGMKELEFTAETGNTWRDSVTIGTTAYPVTYFRYDLEAKIFRYIDPSSYTVGGAIADKVNLYFSLGDTVDALIKKNAAAIVQHHQQVDALLGTNLRDIYLETLMPYTIGNILERLNTYNDVLWIPVGLSESPTPVTDGWENPRPAKDAARNKYGTHEWVRLTPAIVNQLLDGVEAEDDEDVRLYIGPIYTKCTCSTAIDQIKANNDELPHMAEMIYKLRLDVNNLFKRNDTIINNIEKLKILVGIIGNQPDGSDWEVDGYKHMIVTGDDYLNKDKFYYTYKKQYNLIVPSWDAVYDSGTAYYIQNASGKYERVSSAYASAYFANMAKYLAWVNAGSPPQGSADWNGALFVDEFEPSLYSTTDIEDEFEDIDFVGNSEFEDRYEELKGLEIGEYLTKYRMQFASAIYIFDGDGYVEVASPTAVVEAGTQYFYTAGKEIPVEMIGKVYERDTRYATMNTIRGLVDRNTEHIERNRLLCEQHFTWTKSQLLALENFILAMTLATLQEIVQETCTITLLHDTTNRFITVHNAIETLARNTDNIVALVRIENYTLRDIMFQVNELIKIHVNELTSGKNSAISGERTYGDGYMELPVDMIIYADLIYYRPTDWWHQEFTADGHRLTPDMWYEYVWYVGYERKVYTPDPDAVGKRIKDYDPESKWYLKIFDWDYFLTSDEVYTLGKSYFTYDAATGAYIEHVGWTAGDPIPPEILAAGLYERRLVLCMIDANVYTMNHVRMMLNNIIAIHIADENMLTAAGVLTDTWTLLAR